jgi:head-tail adaptor
MLEAPERAPDGSGGYAVLWQPLGVVWAQVDARTGREAAGVGAPLAKVGVKITVRAVAPGAPSRPRPEQRFREGTRLYTISAVADADTDARYLICYAEEETVA